MITDEDINKLLTIFATKEELRQLEERMNNNIKDQSNMILTLVDKVLVEVKATREEQAVHFATHDDINTRLDRLESVTGISH